MLTKKPSDRYSVDECLNHEFFFTLGKGGRILKANQNLMKYNQNIIISNQKFPYNEYQTVESMEKVRKGNLGKLGVQNENQNLTSFSLTKAKGSNFNTQ